jgi:predicted phage-related endonuclease
MSALIISPHAQGSEEWLKARLGVITASQAHDLMLDSRSKTPKYKEARRSYMNQLIGEVCTGYSEEINAKALEWGKTNEDAAVLAFEFASGKQVEKIGLVYKDESKRAGASADFKIVDENCGGENKCPITPKVHIDFLLCGEIKPEYITQVQFGLWVTGWDLWFFTSYHPRMKSKMVHYHEIKRDPALMEYFDNEVPKFIKEMDQELKRIGIEWGAQWR